MKTKRVKISSWSPLDAYIGCLLVRFLKFILNVRQITLENRKLWSEHVKIVHNNRRHKCDRCGKLYPSKAHRDRHFADVHLAEKTHRCAYCNIFYKRRDELIRHYRNKHSEKEQNLVIDSVTLADLSTEYDVTYAHPCDKCYRCFKVFLKNFSLIKD